MFICYIYYSMRELNILLLMIILLTSISVSGDVNELNSDIGVDIGNRFEYVVNGGGNASYYFHPLYNHEYNSSILTVEVTEIEDKIVTLSVYERDLWIGDFNSSLDIFGQHIIYPDWEYWKDHQVIYEWPTYSVDFSLEEDAFRYSINYLSKPFNSTSFDYISKSYNVSFAYNLDLGIIIEYNYTGMQIMKNGSSYYSEFDFYMESYSANRILNYFTFYTVILLIAVCTLVYNKIYYSRKPKNL